MRSAFNVIWVRYTHIHTHSRAEAFFKEYGHAQSRHDTFTGIRHSAINWVGAYRIRALKLTQRDLTDLAAASPPHQLTTCGPLGGHELHTHAAVPAVTGLRPTE